MSYVSGNPALGKVFFTGQVLWIGRETATWSIQVWDSERPALTWASQPPEEKGRIRKVWRVTLDQVTPLSLIITEPQFEDEIHG